MNAPQYTEPPPPFRTTTPTLDQPTFPDVSVARAVIVWLPLPYVVVSSGNVQAEVPFAGS